MNILSMLSLVGGVSETTGSRVATAQATIGLKDGKLYFSSTGFGSQTPEGGMVTGMLLNSGELDLTSIPGSGDVTISINLDDDVWNAGYRFPSDIYQAVAIAFYPANSTTAPTPVFGQASWPAEFDAPSFSNGGKTLVFIDKDDDSSTYEYSIALSKSGARFVLDPKIKNGGQNK